MDVEKTESKYKKGFDFIDKNKIDASWLFCVLCKDDQVPYKFMSHYGFSFVKELYNKYEIDLSYKDNDGHTAFENAVVWGRTEIARWLVEDCEVDPKKVEKNALLLAAGSGTHLSLDLIKYLVEECGFDVNPRDEEGNTPLLIAFKNGGPWCGVMDVANYLILNGADINAKDKDGHSILYSVVWDEYYYSDEDITWLLETGADCLTLDESVEKIWFRAASLGRLSIIKYLVDKQMIDPRCRDEKGNTAVYIAASAMQIEVVKWFIEEVGIDINDRGYAGMTLMSAPLSTSHFTNSNRSSIMPARYSLSYKSR